MHTASGDLKARLYFARPWLRISNGWFYAERRCRNRVKSMGAIIRDAISNWINYAGLTGNDCLFKRRLKNRYIYPPGNMQKLLNPVYLKSDLIHRHMALIHFALLKLIVLSANKKLKGSSVVIESYKAGKHCTLLRYRSRWCFRNGRADRSLITKGW